VQNNPTLPPNAPETRATNTPTPTATLTPLPTPTPIPTVLSEYADQIGVSLGFVGERSLEFTDLALTMRQWETIDAEDVCETDDLECILVPTDENGDPLGDARTVFFDVRPFGSWFADQLCPLCQDGDYQMDMSGIYKLRFVGQADIIPAEGLFAVENHFYDPASNTTTADIAVDPTVGLLFINFENTRRTPASPASSGITDVHLLRPGYDFDTAPTFTDEFLRGIAPFKILRFMDWVGGNDINPFYLDEDNTIDWAERNLPTNRQTDGEGVAWEYVVELANLTGKDVWLNVPIHASDDYIRGLANFLKTNLNPDITIYLEHSNEVWNFGFKQTVYNQLAAEAEVESGSTLNNDGNQNIDIWRQRRHAKRLVDIANIFADVYGRPALNNQIRVIYAWDIWQNFQYANTLAWVNDTYGAPNQYFYGLAGASYFNANGVNPGISDEGVFLTLQYSIDELAERAKMPLQEIANEYGLQFLIYEGGPDTAGNLQWERNTQLMHTYIRNHRDPRMGRTIQYELYNNWFAHPALDPDIYIFFSLASDYNRWGMWGLTEDITRLDTPKYTALTDLMGRSNGVPSAPALSQIITTTNQITITWQPSFRGDSYLVQRSLDDGVTYETVATGLTETQFVDTTMPLGSEPDYVVFADNGYGRSLAGMPALSLSEASTNTPEITITDTLPIDISVASTIPFIDGLPDLVWQRTPTQTISHPLAGQSADPTDLSATFSALYDDTTLYLIIYVQDDVAMYDSERLWDDDAIEIYLDGGNEKTETYDQNDEQYVFRPDGSDFWSQRNKREGVNFGAVHTENGYIMEIAIPLSLFDIIPTPDTQIGFDINIVDDDDGDIRDTKISLFALSDVGWGDPRVFGSLRFTTP
jgi:hypothetical protein